MKHQKHRFSIQNVAFPGFIGVIVLIFTALISGCGGSYSHEITAEHADGSTRTIHYYKEVDGAKQLYKFEEFYEDGLKRVEGYYRNDERDGRWNSWHDNGKLWSVANYKDGKLHGSQIVYYPNGNKYYEGRFENGLRKGVWKFWNEDGVLENEKTY
jgi:antitoxin component YwqK of YwqJK toxin-antitoxin module